MCQEGEGAKRGYPQNGGWWLNSEPAVTPPRSGVRESSHLNISTYKALFIWFEETVRSPQFPTQIHSLTERRDSKKECAMGSPVGGTCFFPIAADFGRGQRGATFSQRSC